MFGFQRIGDLIWAAQDMRAKGFLIGGTAGRTTLNGEGLQHQDGHSLLNAIAFPSVRAYDPAYAYEMAVIILDGMRKLYEEGDTAIYYLMAGNENYMHPAMPANVEEGIVRGMYKLQSREVASPKASVNLFGSGAILRHVLLAQEMLAEKYKIASHVWSVTSYTELRRDAHRCERWNMLHATEKPRQSYVEKTLAGEKGLFVAASDYVRALPEQIARWLPGELYALGTDGMGRSETRESLRRHFEVDAECIVIATLWRLHKQGVFDAQFVAKAIKELGVNPEKVDPYFA
jgi:pyruvate dehydrogenase E1 component